MNASLPRPDVAGGTATHVHDEVESGGESVGDEDLDDLDGSAMSSTATDEVGSNASLSSEDEIDALIEEEENEEVAEENGQQNGVKQEQQPQQQQQQQQQQQPKRNGLPTLESNASNRGIEVSFGCPVGCWPFLRSVVGNATTGLNCSN